METLIIKDYLDSLGRPCHFIINRPYMDTYFLYKIYGIYIVEHLEGNSSLVRIDLRHRKTRERIKARIVEALAL